MTEQNKTRKRRSNGKESRRRILDAAVEVATERGYEGTSIALVSKKSGLPASSIYWHFKDKDELIAAVIERSFSSWISGWVVPEDGTPRERIIALARQVAKTLLESSDFLRLGLMLTLERRPVEPTARTMFLQVREQAQRQLVEAARTLSPDLPEEAIELLATYAMATADGLFIAHEIGGDSVDLLALFELHAHSLYDAAQRLSIHE
ncbi:TetR/AcrR family transcriptional regulator (plasmid) [Rhodococcus pyridinivorans]|uniref:TetR/AcrR family transcriptional regulator n=1 Tax=Rhodococcus pyridinivorans TaxID=103816 RepID=UPI001FFEE4CA|nr:TetR/AcrR family transcriptional regulator [Rhodococcus pyridinivorans]UPK66466.1 TetR/AcrR family transcriptional regulator [Rhodococcus pyridinivorans]